MRVFQAKRQVKAGALALGLTAALGVVSVGCSGSSDSNEMTADALKIQQEELQASDAANDAAAAGAAASSRKGGGAVMPP
jgi:hypothetical protein